ncbi:fumarylacetoacetate hydrolase family protein [Streptomyces sp. VRA16 Mangrove soil]|uniref:fumarylacetoacetate hydrolase family protein n=1 Tax=Streptomyces sp. VRA16 Mangrove soil TaxID=2817434 RepID=UPI001A9D592C|nr:fumarylacetoacetate hydrolase family protein [Streptomyces sp. VRA16 Mangrove soil]MBO1332596.1 fumarylacetoacetate hydrolase family protein [Streptomyces sp. VRA16 Mangrove soil]
MSAAVVRTGKAWWVQRPDQRVRRIDTDAGTTAELLADRKSVEKAAAASGGWQELDERELVSPVTTPCRVVAQMVNYRSHARDSGFDPDLVPTTFFRKASGSVTGPCADVERPAHVRLLDYEVELGLVFGSELELGADVTTERLPHYVAALVVANDFSARDVQLPKTQFYESKSYPTFTPLGPRLVLVDSADLARLERLRLVCEVNGQVRQDSTAADMITRPDKALTVLARFQTMQPGDVLLTGTPGGTALRSPGRVTEFLGSLLPTRRKWEIFFARQAKNPAYLQPGDVVTSRIASLDGGLDLGLQRTTVRNARTSS